MIHNNHKNIVKTNELITFTYRILLTAVTEERRIANLINNVVDFIAFTVQNHSSFLFYL